MPAPNARCWLSGRVMSRSSGLANWAGSRLAAARNATTGSPCLSVAPPSSTDSLATVRPVRWTGPSKRKSSSTARWDVGSLDDVRARYREGVERLGQRGRPLVEAVAILLRNAQELADHDDWQWVGELGDQVERAARRHRVDQVVHHLLDARPEPL